ncbi:unnamed protein product, partial [Pleuronectes platessa]
MCSSASWLRWLVVVHKKESLSWHEIPVALEPLIIMSLSAVGERVMDTGMLNINFV